MSLSELENPMSQTPVTIRPGWPADFDFIYATWLKGLYYGNSWFEMIPSPIYYGHYKWVLTKILNRRAVYIQTACLEEDPEVILGYAILERFRGHQVLHWVYIKEVWRKMGIAKRLLPENIKQITHLTSLGLQLKPEEWEFNPFLI